MKLLATTATLALLCTSALAAPSKACAAKPHKQEKGGDWEDSLAEFKEKFTSTWKVVGTPDQVVLANGTAAPGESSSIGYYNFGINSEKDLICWVCRRSPSSCARYTNYSPPAHPPQGHHWSISVSSSDCDSHSRGRERHGRPAPRRIPRPRTRRQRTRG